PASPVRRVRIESIIAVPSLLFPRISTPRGVGAHWPDFPGRAAVCPPAKGLGHPPLRRAVAYRPKTLREAVGWATGPRRAGIGRGSFRAAVRTIDQTPSPTRTRQACPSLWPVVAHIASGTNQSGAKFRLVIAIGTVKRAR